MTPFLLALALAPIVALPLQTTSTGQIVVPVTIGTHAGLPFLLDTGASGSLITPETSRLLGKFPRDGRRKAEVVGAGGTAGNGDAVIVPGLEVGARHYRKMTLVVSPIEDVSNDSALPGALAGILGRDFLEQNVLEIDFPAKALRLFPSVSHVSPQPAGPPSHLSLEARRAALAGSSLVISLTESSIAIQGGAVESTDCFRQPGCWEAPTLSSSLEEWRSLRPAPDSRFTLLTPTDLPALLVKKTLQSLRKAGFTAATLVMANADSPPYEDLFAPLLPIPLKVLPSGLLVVGVSLDGRLFDAVLDIGAQASIVNFKAARWKPAMEGTDGAMAIGLDGAPLALSPHRFTSFSVGQEEFDQPTLYVGDLPVFQSLGFGEEEPAMILGMDLLAGRVVRIDFRGSLLCISAKM